MIVTIAALLALNDPTPLQQTLLGSWIGTLEYRDYSDDFRERLGTLLRVSKDETSGRLVFRYVYDDGPNKVVQDSEQIDIDLDHAKYSIFAPDSPTSDDYTIQSKRLKPDGTGAFVLIGKAKENSASVDIRETITLSKDRLRILRESKLPGQDFKFRHEFMFTRVTAPKS
jgi:hypothetical protein